MKLFNKKKTNKKASDTKCPNDSYSEALMGSCTQLRVLLIPSITLSAATNVRKKE